MYSGGGSGSDGVGPSRGGALPPASRARYQPYSYGSTAAGSRAGPSAGPYGSGPGPSQNGGGGPGSGGIGSEDESDKEKMQTPFYGALGPTPAPGGGEGKGETTEAQPSYRLAPIEYARGHSEDAEETTKNDAEADRAPSNDAGGGSGAESSGHPQSSPTLAPPIHDKDARSKSPSERPASAASGRRTPSVVGPTRPSTKSKSTTHPTSSTRGGGKDEDDEDDEEEEEEVDDGDDPDDPDYTGD